MARGDFTLFEEFAQTLGDGQHDLSTDTLSVILITTLPTAADATPDRADYTEVTAGGGYSTGGIALTGKTYVETAGVAKLDATNTLAWTQTAGSPINIVAGLLVNDAVVTSDAIGFIDITTGGGTPVVSLVDNPINIDWHASGIFTLTIA